MNQVVFFIIIDGCFRTDTFYRIRPKTADFLNHIPRIYFAVKKSHV
jgi:hypothetical protein